MNLNELKRFIDKIKIDPVTECWEWQGSRFKNTLGYGRFKLESQKGADSLAHRVSFEHFVGSIPEGYVVAHDCNNPPCVNPEHLVATTQRNNIHSSNTVAHVRSQQTHCKRGHEFTFENTYITNVGYRQCKTCRNETARLHYESKKKSIRDGKAVGIRMGDTDPKI